MKILAIIDEPFKPENVKCFVTLSAKLVSSIQTFFRYAKYFGCFYSVMRLDADLPSRLFLFTTHRKLSR